MQHPSYGSPSSFSSGSGSLSHRERFLGWDWDKKLHYDRELPVWSTESPKELIVTQKRPWQESQPDERSKRVAWDRLTFVPGTFRPVVIVDDDGGLDPVVPRKIDRSGWSRDCPLVVEDNWGDSAITDSRATKPDWEFKPTQKHLSWVDATTKRIARKPSGRTQSPSDIQESAPWTGPYLPKVNLQESLGDSNSAASNAGLSPTWKHSTWLNRRYHPYLSREPRSTSLPTSLEEAQNFVPRSTPQATERESGALSDTHVTRPVQRAIVKESLSLRERKRFFIYTPTPALEAAMEKFVEEVYSVFLHYLDEEECWLHPSPPRGLRRAKGCLNRNFRWTDEGGRHKLTVNYGIIALLFHSFLTETQKEGWTMDSWHLSHLCGNWTCCNWRHFTVEPGRVNISRNACFMHRSGCGHEPKCMKEKKRRLSQTPRVTEQKMDHHQAPRASVEQYGHSNIVQDWPEVLYDTASPDLRQYL